MRVTVDRAGRIVLPKPIRDAVGLTGGQEVEVRLAGVVMAQRAVLGQFS